jgi:hypothetical protein
MAGQGWKSFSSNEVLTAANLQGYAVDQSTMVFASSAARSAALAAPSQGMVSWLNDSGTAWQYFELYNASTNPGGASAAGWYPISGAAMFYGTATKSTANSTTETLGAAGFLYTEIIDPLGWHSAATNTDRITPTVAGLYRITPTIQWASGAAGDRRVTINKNGAIYLEQRIGVGTGVYNNVSVVLSMNGSTDYFTVTCFQSSGGAVTVTCQNAIEFLRPSQS